MSTNNIIKIKSPDGFILYYDKNYLINNPYIKHTILEKTFFGNFYNSDEIVLYYGKHTLSQLVPLIREGIIYPPSWITNNSFGLKSNHLRIEIYKMLDYIAGDNITISSMASIIRIGAAMDIFGRQINLNNMDILSYNHISYMIPYDNNISKDLRNKFMWDIDDNIIKLATRLYQKKFNSLVFNMAIIHPTDDYIQAIRDQIYSCMYNTIIEDYQSSIEIKISDPNYSKIFEILENQLEINVSTIPLSQVPQINIEQYRNEILNLINNQLLEKEII
ncbi:hypothetical protein QKC54_gp0144 [Megavirus baoshan]|uniref:DUF5866 domain-containing protein n=1 Tax=Megavirus baoshan TaxID=2496520 RepID=A0A3S8UYB3_9VIRU|nr:hypothetical protein QKC54_gp0144 [Megavirus baoshan]AZL89772.1 hypothetical protein Mb0928 [Megavirus baoshan]